MALSEKFTSTSYVLGEAHEIRFNKGNLVQKEHKVNCPAGRQGTTVYMEPDIDILGPVNLTCQEIFTMVANIVPLLPLNTTIEFVGFDLNDKPVINEKLVNIEGIFTYLKQRAMNPIINPVHFGLDTGVMKADVVFTYDSTDLTSSEDILSFANFTNTTEGGTHVIGFLEGVCNYLRNYMNKIYLADNKRTKLVINNNDIKVGLKAVVSVAHINPIFKGQFKGILSNKDIQDFVRKLTTDAMDNWSKTSPTELAKVAKFIKEVGEIRAREEKERVKLSDNYSKNTITGKPRGYIQPSAAKNLELFIVEGRSALGPCASARSFNQGIFPIRGKIINCFTATKQKALANQEVSAIINLVGGGYGRDFDINKVKFDKVCLLADADSDKYKALSDLIEIS